MWTHCSQSINVFASILICNYWGASAFLNTAVCYHHQHTTATFTTVPVSYQHCGFIALYVLLIAFDCIKIKKDNIKKRNLCINAFIHLARPAVLLQRFPEAYRHYQHNRRWLPCCSIQHFHFFLTFLCSVPVLWRALLCFGQWLSRSSTAFWRAVGHIVRMNV